MESKKVKEIKKYFEERDVIYFADILTYINELESENERLGNESNEMFDKYGKELQIATILIEKRNNEIIELKDRIYKLEYGIAKSMLGCEFLPECTNEKLKQLAERLKEKLLYGYFTTYCEVEVYIDETLNEFIKGENNN